VQGQLCTEFRSALSVYSEHLSLSSETQRNFCRGCGLGLFVRCHMPWHRPFLPIHRFGGLAAAFGLIWPRSVRCGRRACQAPCTSGWQCVVARGRVACCSAAPAGPAARPGGRRATTTRTLRACIRRLAQIERRQCALCAAAAPPPRSELVRDGPSPVSSQGQDAETQKTTRDAPAAAHDGASCRTFCCRLRGAALRGPGELYPP
jgi:hypothetical protein